MKEFGLSLIQITSIGTAFYFLFGAGAIPSGAIGDRWSDEGVLIIFLIGASLSSFLVGYSKSVVAFAISLCLLGAFISLYHPVGFSLLSRGVRGRGKAMGLHGIAGNVGLAGAPLLAGFIAAEFSWRYVYYLMALPGIVVGFVLFLFRLDFKAEGVVREAVATQVEKDINWPLLILLFVAMGLSGFINQGVMTILPTYFSTRIGYLSLPAIAKGGLFTTVVLAVGAIGQYVGGHLSDRARPDRLYLYFYLLSLPFMLIIGFALNLPLVLAASAFAIFHFANQPVETTLIAENTPTSWRSRSYGLMFAMIFGFGSLSAVVSGFIGENLGLPTVFFILSAVIAIGATVIFALGRLPSLTPRRSKTSEGMGVESSDIIE